MKKIISKHIPQKWEIEFDKMFCSRILEEDNIKSFFKYQIAEAYKRGIEEGRGLKDNGISVRDVT